MTGEAIYEVHDHNFQEKVIEHSRQVPVLVDFWADWCSPCLVLDPVLKSVLKDMPGRFVLAKVEVDEGDNMRLAGHYKLRGFPTVILFRDGEPVGRFSGARHRQWLEEWLEEHLG